jgi:hypothetical protein
VIVVAHEGCQLGRPLGGGEGHQKDTFSNKIGKGQSNRPVLKNVKDLHRTPKFRLSPARGLMLKTPLTNFLTSGWTPTLTPSMGAIVMESVDRWIPMVLHEKNLFVEVREEDQHMGQDRSLTARWKRRLSP